MTASPRPAFVDLSWEPSSPEAMVDHYAVYVSTNDFLTVEGAATETTTGTSVTIGGLDSERTYHFAVVAVNLSGGMDRDVITIEASPLPGTAVSGNITTNTTWTVENSPYVVTGNVTVRDSGSNGNTATLTIEPGVEVRFESGTGLYIGYRYYSRCYHGALSAQGTSVEPILFTSNADVPAPGDWRGIVFQDDTTDELTLLK
ncbi:fibronectin type III domain-containing protein, partial [Desulfosarcina cetonica]|uniref:fibronectin type III domain-containing protein n=1 Tax=Desulfosarcina cetonica TaxID=90730 RepID=UPI00155DBD41